MSPAQIERFNFWGPTLAAALGVAFSAGIAYAVIGSDVTRNSQDIKEIKVQATASASTMADVRVDIGKLGTKIEGLSGRVTTLSDILIRQYGPPGPG